MNYYKKLLIYYYLKVLVNSYGYVLYSKRPECDIPPFLN